MNRTHSTDPNQLPLHHNLSRPTDRLLMPMTHAPETGARKLAPVSGASVIQSGVEFFWHQILESDRTVFYFATKSGDHVIKILICDWSVINVVVVFICWSCKFCLYFRLLKLFNLFNLFSLFNVSWTDSEIESLITFYSSMLVSGARNVAAGMKNRRRFLESVIGIRNHVLDGVQTPHVTGQFWGQKGAGLWHVRQSIYSRWVTRGQNRYGAYADWVHEIGEWCILVPPGEYDWTVCLWQQCCVMSNYFEHLLYLACCYGRPA